MFNTTRVAICTFLVFGALTSSVYGIPFTVSGTALLPTDGELNRVDVTGFVSINEDPYASEVILANPDLSRGGYLRYNYSFFDINIGDDNFTGSGWHDTFFYDYTSPEDPGFATAWDELSMRSFDGSLRITSLSFGVEFYGEDGTIYDPYDPYAYFELPYMMRAVEIVNMGGMGAIESFTIQRVGWTAPAPVPEPSTIILFGMGFAGLAGLTWRRKK